MNDEAEATYSVLNQLLLKSRRAWVRNKKIKTEIALGGSILENHVLEGYFRKRFPTVRFPPATLSETMFPLPPVRGSFLPLLSFDWKFEAPSGIPRGAFRLHMIPLSPAARAKRDASPFIHVLRFDAHESNSQWGFCHVQNCERPDAYSAWKGLDKDIVSDELPRIPLVGVRLDAPGLLLTLVTGLYGVGSDEFNMFIDPRIRGSSSSVEKLIHDLRPT